MDDFGCRWTVWEGHGNTPGLAATGVTRIADGPSLGGNRGALAHVAADRGEAAYARSDLFEGRCVLMDDWARYLAQRSREDPDPLE